MESTWVKTAKVDSYPQLDHDIDTDVVIIGGGMAGTTALYFLAQAGVKAVLLDKGSLTDSVTAYTTAFVGQFIDTDLTELQKLFGDDKAKQIWQSSKYAVDLVKMNIENHGIDCEYQTCSYYKFATDSKAWQDLVEEADLVRKYGFEVEQGRDQVIVPKNFGYIALKEQVKFHPLKYLNVLRQKAVEKGGQIFEQTEVTHLSEDEPAVIQTSKGKVRARKVFVATYYPFHKPRELFAHTATYTTYVMELKVPSGSVGEALYEDSKSPYHYFRVDQEAGFDRVILGGEDHRHELPLNPKKAYAALQQYFKEILPGVSYEVVRQWQGPIIEPIDGLPYIGAYSDKAPHIFVATGFSGSGMTFGTLAGYMFAEFVQNKKVPWGDLYNPQRTITLSQFWRRFKYYTHIFFGAYARNVFKKPL